MAEGTLSGTVNVPKVGKVKKVYFWGAIGVVGAYVGWRWYTANAAGAADDVSYETSGVAGEDVYSSGVVGAGGVSGNTQYAGSTTDGTGTDTIDTNGEWTQAATDYLAAQGREASVVGSALGEFIARRPLDDSEQAIARAAMAAFGQPPQDRPWTIIPQVGPVTLAAPTNLKASNVTATSVTLTYSPVTGAGYYRAYHNRSALNVGATDGTTITVGSLQPNTEYKFQVAADTTTGKPGPRSAAVTVKTTGASLKAPTGLKVRARARTSVQIGWNTVPGAQGYMLQRSGGPTWESTDPADTVAGLKPNTSYKVRVAALQPNTRKPGPYSGWFTIKTNK